MQKTGYKSLFANLGKYRAIVLSICLFLIFDASVLILNFYISFTISEDAKEINVAGDQRTLSQRVMKSLFTVANNLDDPTSAIEELTASAARFDNTLKAFASGGELGTTDGGILTLQRVSTPAAIAAVEETEQRWQPLKNNIEILANQSVTSMAFATLLNRAIIYGEENNLLLLDSMDKLTRDLEQQAGAKARLLRMIQAVGITLAVINFFIILFHFIRQLQDSDSKLEAAQGETREILDTVSEGLFLLDRNMVIGAQYSKELETIFQSRDIAGRLFKDMLTDMVTAKDMETARDFIELLFKPSVKTNLIGDLNPLDLVEIHLSNSAGKYENKFLSFGFSRVNTGSDISHVLVTVKDITRQVQLARELEQAQEEATQQMELLSSLISCDSAELPGFIDNSLTLLQEINQTLENPARLRSQYLEKLDSISTRIHRFKGDSAAFQLDKFVDLAHEFEDALSPLKEKPDLTGQDFLGVAVLLERLITHVEIAQDLVNKLRHLNRTPQSSGFNAQESEIQRLQSFATSIADEHHKQVLVTYSGLSDKHVNARQRELISSISTQLMRNSVIHGIEPVEERQTRGKQATGEVQIHLALRGDNEIVYKFSDDGRGLDVGTISQAALKKGLISEQQLSKLDNKQLARLIFSPGFSTFSEQTDVHAGRGQGMSAVKEMASQLAGRISVGSRSGRGLTFSMTFPRHTD